MRRVIVPLILSSLATPAGSREITSAYIDLVLDKCRKIAEGMEVGEEWIELQCDGFDGIEVRVIEGDLRFTVSLGPNTENQCAAPHTFGNFNYPGPRIEWRTENGKPFATILRWYQHSDEETANWLIVSKYDNR